MPCLRRLSPVRLCGVRLRLMPTAALMLAAAFVAAPQAYASCATEAMVSPYAFVGTVISTERKITLQP
jgi:hypothetical protein